MIKGELIAKRDVIYRQAQSVANAFVADKLNDFRLPTRIEAALLYTNLQDLFEDRWYWTGEKYPPDEKVCVWVQTFGYGRQADARMTDACRVVAVRAFPCE